jgi:anti-sigma factor RsiW
MEADTIHELTAAYALDALDEVEEAQYEAHLARCPRCREELASFQAAAATLAYGVEGPPPPSALRDRIIAQAVAERPNVVALGRPDWRSRWVAVAAVAAVAALGFGLWSASLSRSLEREREARSQVDRALAVLADPDARRVPLSGDNGSLVVSNTGEAALVLRSLPAAPSGKDYEAWVVEDGTPRPAGLFEGGGAVAVGLDRPVPDGALVAVTLERDGGVDMPSGRQVLRSEPA